jgi:hypothetical protein
MRAVLIRTEGPPEVVEQDGLDDLQKHVGGWVEGLPCRIAGCVAWGNEEAKMIATNCPTCEGHGANNGEACEDCMGGGYVEGLPYNPLGTFLVYGDPVDARRQMQEEMDLAKAAGAFVVDVSGGDVSCAGPILITGIDRAGASQPIPEGAIAVIDHLAGRIKHHGSMKVAA